MSSLTPLVADDSIEGSIISNKSEPVEYQEQKPKLNLRDRIIDYVKTHEKSTKVDIHVGVSSSGITGTIITALVKQGVFIEKFFDCHNCTYFEVDNSKIIEL